MREWLVDLVGEGMAPIASWLLAAAIVIILVFVVIWVAKKALGGSMGPRAKGRGPRLAVMDVAAIDPKRKLVLIRRDEVEHLLLIGGQNDLVVEPHILRVPASARGQRTEPTMRQEPEAPIAAERPAQPFPAVAAPTPQPATQAGPQTGPQPAPRLSPSAAPKPQQPRGAAASPLTRAVPRAPTPDAQPMQANEVAAPRPPQDVSTARASEQRPAEAMPAPIAKDAIRDTMTPRTPSSGPAGPLMDLTPAITGPAQPGQDQREIAAPRRVAGAPEVVAERPSRIDAGEAEKRTPPPVAVGPVAAQEQTPAPALAPTKAPAQPPLAGASTEALVAGEEAAPAAETTRTMAATMAGAGAGVGIVAPAVVVPVEARDAATGVTRAEAALPGGPVQPQAPVASQAPAASQTPVLISRPQSGLPEPIRRTIQEPIPAIPAAAPAQPRSMATPTLPSKTPFFVLEDDETRDLVFPPLAAPSKDVAASAPSVRTAGPAPAAASERPAAQGAGEPALPAFPSMTPGRPLATMSPIIAAAERQRDALRARPTGQPSVAAPSAASGTARGPASEIRPAESEEDAAEKRPLSVRSFATSIQSMKPSYEPGPAARPAATLPANTTAPAQTPAAIAPLVRVETTPQDPAFVPPVVTAPSASAIVPAIAPPVAPVVKVDAEGSLEDFLSAELDSDFGNVKWDDERQVSSPAPEIKPEPRTEVRRMDAQATQDAATQDLGTQDLGTQDPKDGAEAPARVLSLEEEMERLLGDFDFEVSDRKAR